jgi:hypothetical protein
MGTPISNTDIGDVLMWEHTPSATGHAYNSNSTGGTKKRIRGAKDGSGQIKYLLDTDAAEPLANGDTPSLVLQVTSGKTRTVPAFIESVSTEVDVDNGGIVTHVAKFSANGAPTMETYP